MAYTSIEDALKDYTVDVLDMSMYEVAQLSQDELQDKLQTYYETSLADLTLDERESKINDLTSQISDQLDSISDYVNDLSDQVEASQEAGEVAQASSDQRLLTDLQTFLEGDGSNLSSLTTTITNTLFLLGSRIVDTDADEYFTYNQLSSNVMLGGETMRYNLTSVVNDSELTPEETNYADTNNDGIADVDINGDGTIDAKDLVEDVTPYDLSGQELYIELNPGDRIISAVYDKETQLFSFEIETFLTTIENDDGSPLDVGGNTFMLEVHVEDPAAAHIILQGEDYGSIEDFKNVDHEGLAMLYDQTPVTSMLKTLYPENDTPDANAQLSAIAGYTDCLENISSSVSTLNSAFATTENSFAFPANAEDVLAEMYNAVFDNEMLNSYSDFSADDAAANFHSILNQYSDTEQAALTMAFCMSFIKTDPAQFTELMAGEIYTMQDTINVYGNQEGATISMVEKAMHALIETSTGMGKYTGSMGGIFASGEAFATDTGTEGKWKDHEENIAALQFCVDNGFDTTGAMNEVITHEQSLIDGEISETTSFNLLTELSNISTNELFWEWQVDLTGKDWTNAVNYLSDHLLDKNGQLVDNPLKVFKDCINKFFDGGDAIGADNFASTFLYACDIKGADGLNSLMTGPYGKDIAKYLWNITENGGTEPKFYEEAKTYKNSIT